jgi:hypothetical protein
MPLNLTTPNGRSGPGRLVNIQSLNMLTLVRQKMYMF